MKKVIALFLFILIGIYYLNPKSSDSKITKTTIQKGRKIASVNKDVSIGTVYFCKGIININNKQYKCENIKDKSVFENDIFKTSKKSFVKIHMIDKTKIMLGPNSHLKIEKYKVKNKNSKSIVLDVIKGLLHTNFTEKVKEGSAFVKTRSAAMGVRGTEFITEYDGNKTRVMLFHGLINIKTNKEEFYLNSNEVINIYNNNEYQVENLDNEWTKSMESSFLIEDYIPKLKNDFIDIIDKKEKIINNNKFNKKESSINNKSLEKDLIDNLMEEKIKGIKKSSVNDEKMKKYLNKKFSKIKDRIELDLDNSTESELLKKELKKYSRKVLDRNLRKVEYSKKKGTVYPLIKPDGEVVYFEDNPSLLTKIPRDKDGNIIGIKVDEDLNPIAENALLIDRARVQDEITKKTINVINEDGEVGEIMVVTEFDQLIELPEDGNKSIILSDKGEISIVNNELMKPTKEVLSNIDNQNRPSTNTSNEITPPDLTENVESQEKIIDGSNQNESTESSNDSTNNDRGIIEQVVEPVVDTIIGTRGSLFK